MRIVSVNVGLPREVTWNGATVSTGIFKQPVPNRIALRRHQLDGDGQADLSVHGGPTKAAYAYPVQHYDYWREQVPSIDFGWGSFGENLTVEGLAEESVCIGDEYRVGSARVVVTEPRMPCFKRGIRFGRADMVKGFLKSQRTGFYFGVVEEGDVAAGDPLELVAKHPAAFPVADVTRLYTTEKENADLLRRATALSALPAKWRDYFEDRLVPLRR